MQEKLSIVFLLQAMNDVVLKPIKSFKQRGIPNFTSRHKSDFDMRFWLKIIPALFAEAPALVHLSKS